MPRKSSEFTKEDAALLDELEVPIEPEEASRYTPREERIVAGFEEIQRFADRRGRPPNPGARDDLFERLYAARLNRIRELEECGEILAPLGRHGLLTDGGQGRITGANPMDDDELLVELGVNADVRDATKLGCSLGLLGVRRGPGPATTITSHWFGGGVRDPAFSLNDTRISAT